jgi:hypothetical protein
MASNTMATWNKRTRTHKNIGRKRKNKEARKSTPSAAELFAALGEPGKAAPAGAAKPAPKATKKAAPAKKPAA